MRQHAAVTTHQRSRNRRLGVAICVAAVSSVAAPPMPAGAALAAVAETHAHRAVTPTRSPNEIADVVIRIDGGAMCSGTPIAGTRFVVTAAHCVINSRGELRPRSVHRDGVAYPASAVLVDMEYHDRPRTEIDAAVLVLDEQLPGPAATIGASLPAAGTVTLAGLQVVDGDGSRLRGTHPRELRLARDSSGRVVATDPVVFGCETGASDLDVSAARVTVECGLVPGASGGGLFTRTDDGLVLVGILSTVSRDLTQNGVVPLAGLHRLLRNQTAFWHELVVRHGGRTSVVHS